MEGALGLSPPVKHESHHIIFTALVWRKTQPKKINKKKKEKEMTVFEWWGWWSSMISFQKLTEENLNADKSSDLEKMKQYNE